MKNSWKEYKSFFLFSAISGFRAFEIDKTTKIQGKIKTIVFGNFYQKWLFDFHKAHMKEGSICMKKIRENKMASFDI